ncbi:hypothetical protein H112_08716 [Trichophyton rubrum D6]|uniref:Uncharacterized protein n=1 Tax=Trichophyton rubrum CBS 288.86 TaxID=1215330 RepID=A0A022VN68_TRIRU|nr:hypothetical protein H100_08738 [Trichophyton rubrum MR850]EZF36841.1 hypothetical protein H102_08697 [Trichophyton rubrum CBS 100081]EZF47436.1 hypothetical protein H103_08719 [Trichophyton rubrum CBS 288.86]EZF58094.1 hypothetical protein H104_08671 [Trichophyton rubrum CBS 289.86]EZF79395.1 hypothetical protein H110_08722 [Trichophyton rubrum MR1448]EZF90150.1 hypothetical protein H113_08788 [Trichophyton rubrum MR1459]EZG01260.1 hypothetical protein H106_08593 [Trichophyton rubrum CBS 
MGAVVSCIVGAFHAIGRALMTIVNAIGSVLMAIVNGTISILHAIISFLTCGWCSGRRSRVGGHHHTRRPVMSSV